VEMGAPDFAPQSLPMRTQQAAPVYALRIDAEDVQFGAVSVGNPHVVVQVPDVDTAPVERVGAALGRHPEFPRRTNVGFMQVVNRGNIRLRVYERGVGETKACGTGACAAVAIGRRQGALDANVQVNLPGGAAQVSWEGPGAKLWLTGPATTVFTGSIEI
jgi:diaminopimelate epimerase